MCCRNTRAGQPDGMPLRILMYQAQIWRQRSARRRVAKGLPVVFAVVAYQGRKRWREPTALTDLHGIDEGARARFGPLLTSSSFLLDDLTRVSADRLRSRPLTPAARLAFVFLDLAPGSGDLTAGLAQWWDDFEALRGRPGWTEVLTGLLTYALTVSNTPESSLIGFLAGLGSQAKEVAMTTAEKLRAEGRAEGMAAGGAKVLGELLVLKFGELPAGVEQRLRAASPGQLDVWVHRLLDATSLDEIFS